MVMNERGLIFCGQLMAPLLSGAKKRTMRLVARHNSLVDGHAASKELWSQLRFDEAWVDQGPSPMGNAGPYLKVPRTADGDEYVHRVYPRFWLGDVIWSRETWGRSDGWAVPEGEFLYRANLPADDHSRVTWKSPLHQPRVAARFISPPLAAVFPQRPSALDDAQCLAEGVESSPTQTPGESFAVLWREIHGEASCVADPWCWAYQWGAT